MWTCEFTPTTSLELTVNVTCMFSYRGRPRGEHASSTKKRPSWQVDSNQVGSWGWPPHDCATFLSYQWHIKTSLIKLVWNIIHWLVLRGTEEINPLLHCIAFRLESFNFWHLRSTLSGQREKWSQSATEMDLINLLWLVAKDCEGSANQMQSMYVVIYLFCPTLSCELTSVIPVGDCFFFSLLYYERKKKHI